MKDTRRWNSGAVREALRELAGNLCWSWSRDAATLWSRAAETLPRARRAALLANPVLLVRALQPRDLAVLAADGDFLRGLEHSLTALRKLTQRASTRRQGGLTAKHPVAYFSMEFGVHESLPIYAGGLGILAGDHTKSASDLQVPLVGVGLMYHRGYYRQLLEGSRTMRVKYPRNVVTDLPLGTARDANGKELRVAVEVGGHKVWVKAWVMHVGRVPVYLLDTNLSVNRPRDRGICRYLYGGTREDRIRQEVVVGIGGVRMLRALGIQPSVWHLNEGHVAFLSVERLRELRGRSKLSVNAALEILAADTLFTTHTPVPEGNEVFDLPLVQRYLEPHLAKAHMPAAEYLALGLDTDSTGRSVFSMTVLAIRTSSFRNGVSALHGEVAREMWQHLWPSFCPRDVPIGSVTNGIHPTTWIAPEMAALFDKRLGREWKTRLADSGFWRQAKSLPALELWRTKEQLKERLIEYVRSTEKARLRRAGWSSRRIAKHVAKLLRPDALTIGFARRFALYKRAALLFKDVRRAQRLFASSRRPVQIIFAGKPHPEDPAGKKLYEQVAAISCRREFTGKVVVLENYDMEIGRILTQGCDVWLNTPRRPLEASGTSGQKVPINGGLNLSILDGWWCEGYSPSNGWAFGTTDEHAGHGRQDKDDAAALYRTLERDVIPLFFKRDGRGVPGPWLRMVKSSMADLVPRFSSHRMVEEYVSEYYLPAAERGRQFRAAGGRRARKLVEWQERVCRSWPLIQVRSADWDEKGRLDLELFLGEIAPSDLVWRNGRGQEAGVDVLKEHGAGLFRVAIAARERKRGGRQAEQRFLLFPRHEDQAHPEELGLGIEIVV